MFGQPADYAAIGQIAARHNLLVVADAAQSFGAELSGKRVGTLADYTSTSFFPAKPLGCYGDGGAIFVEDKARAETLRSLRFHGKGSHKYENVRVGLNSRLDTFQAAILLEKILIFPEEIEARQAVARRYDELLSAMRTPYVRPGATSVWAQYTIRLPDDIARAKVQASCEAAGVPTAVYYPIPLHRQPAYAHHPRDPKGLGRSEQAAEHVLSLPMHPYLAAASQVRIAKALMEAVRA